jgi:Holliday junction resolvase RusA-like endonuclease
MRAKTTQEHSMALDPTKPPEFGELTFEVPAAPVSQQASGAAKEAIREHVRSITRPLQYVIDTEVQVELEWFIHERLRWETDSSPDVDNIIKPLLDGLCGPEGVIVDDCQVQSVTSSWIDWTRDDQQVCIRLKFSPDHFLLKEGLVFARVQNALCFPVPKEVQEKALGVWLDAIDAALAARAKIEQATNSYYPARYVLPPGLIHVSRLHGFPVIDVAELRKKAAGT